MVKRDIDLGFSVVEALLILVVVSILGFTGWYVYHARQTSDKDYSSAASSTVPTYKKKASTKTTTTASANTYTGWNTCDDMADGVSFKYPTDWKIIGVNTPSVEWSAYGVDEANAQAPSASSDPCASFTLSEGESFVLQSPSNNGLTFSLSYVPAVSKANLSKSNSGTTGDSELVQSVSPLALSSGKSVSLVSYVDTDTTSSTNGQVSDMGLSDQSYSVGQSFKAFNGITSPTNSNYSVNMEVTLAPPGSQDVRMYTPAQYQAQPSYDDLMNILKSVSY